MMRYAILSGLLILAVASLSAQGSFQKKISVPLDSPLIRCTPDGAYVYLAATVTQGGQARLQVLKIDASGNVVWRLQRVGANTGLRLNDVLPLSDGLLLAITSAQNDGKSDAFLQKLDADGHLVWGKRIGPAGRTRLFEIEKDAQENIFLSGQYLPDQNQTPDSVFFFLMYLAPDGTIIHATKSRHHYFPNSDDEIYRLTNLNWNPSDASLSMIEDFNGLYTNSYISALNRGTWSLGHTHETLDYSEQLWNIQFSAIRSTSNRIAFSGQTIFISEFPAIGLLDASGKNMKVLKATPYMLQPVHSYNADIYFYDPQNKTLTRYDTTLTPVWTRSFGSCIETMSFDADVAQNGVIFTVRNIAGQTILSRILPDGSLAGCEGHPAQPTPAQPMIDQGVGDNSAIWGVTFPPFATDSALVFTPQQTEVADYCLPLYASFLLPDSVCLGADIPLSEVDTSAGISHGWQFGAQSSPLAMPEISFPEAGLFTVSHTVSNPFCTDKASSMIQVIPAPVLLLNDTVVCGPATFAIDLTQPAATQYWLNGSPVGPMLSLSASGVYDFRVANAQCSDEQTIQLKIVAFPWPIADPDTTLCGGIAYPAVFDAGFENIIWDGQAHPDTFLILDAAAHTYTATYSADPECVIQGEIKVPRLSCDADLLYVPNSFSPNDDSKNDFFEISPTADAEVLQFSVYDRWGTCLFQSSPARERWDGIFRGAKLPPGVYVYWIQVRNKLTNEVLIKTGDLTLFR